jgi:hypothetical protein
MAVNTNAALVLTANIHHLEIAVLGNGKGCKSGR